MLVLGGKEGEKFMLDEDIVIELLEIKGGYVRVGFTAPKTITILREKVYLREQLEKAS